jgi:GT2 family glycosyltransferase
MKLSIVIVNYNVKHFLEQCLLSVQKALAGIDGEVWVVDNTSVDGSQQMVAEKFPWVKLVANTKNVGFSKGNNQAIRECKGEYVLLLNPDTVVEETTFSKIIAFMDAHPDAGALGVKMIDGNGKFLPESKRALPTHWVAFYKIFGLARIFPKNRKFGKYHLTYLDKDQNHEIEILSGAFMFMRKSVLDKIGLLDEDFFMYGEDIDLSYRVIKAGYKNWYFADTKIIHYKGESTKKSSVNYVLVFYNAMIIFARKHFDKGQLRFFVLLIRMAVYMRMGMAILARLWKRIAFPLLELGMIYAAIYGIKEYWEYAHKLLKDDRPYPEGFDYIANPIYSLVFVLLLAATGSYKRPYRIRPIMTASFSGFVAIATVSYLFPEINFSRMIVGLAAVGTFLLALLNRGLINLKERGNFFFTEENRRRVALVGEGEEVERISRLIRTELRYPVIIEGTVATSATEKPREDRLGELHQLQEIINIYKIDEVVFANKSMPTEQLLSLMSELRHADVNFKIVPPDVNYLVGPNVIHSSLFNEPFYFNLDRKESRVRKRVFDVMSSLCLILFFPLTFWMYKRPFKAFANLFHVLGGHYHLVGYINDNPPGLPSLKRGILNMRHRLRKSDPAQGTHASGLDRHYARSYSLELDMEILLKGLRNLGGAGS